MDNDYQRGSGKVFRHHRITVLIFFHHAQAPAVKVVVNVSPVNAIPFLELFSDSERWHFRVSGCNEGVQVSHEVRPEAQRQTFGIDPPALMYDVQSRQRVFAVVIRAVSGT